MAFLRALNERRGELSMLSSPSASSISIKALLLEIAFKYEEALEPTLRLLLYRGLKHAFSS